MDPQESMVRRVPGKAMATALALVAILIAAYFIFRSFGPSAPASRPASGNTRNPAPAGTDIGTEIYQKSANPISGKLPQTAAPVPNPIQSVYKNPFR